MTEFDAVDGSRHRHLDVPKCGCCMNRRMAHYFAGFEDEQEYADPDYFQEVFLPDALESSGLWFERYLTHDRSS